MKKLKRAVKVSAARSDLWGWQCVQKGVMLNGQTAVLMPLTLYARLVRKGKKHGK